MQTRAFLALARTAACVLDELNRAVKPRGLSPAGYNVLRVLQGNPKGLPCHEIRARMFTTEPDLTRLIDRLGKLGLVERDRVHGDRRLVIIRLTAAGWGVLAALEESVQRLNQRRFALFSPEELRRFVEALERITLTDGK